MNTVIWRMHDGKPGHANQTRGLVNALSDILPVQCHDLLAPARTQSLKWWFAKQFPPGKTLPRPQLILGAGHSTHLAMLAARRCYGGKAIVLMKPSLPPRLFDLCIVPEHDGLAAAPHVVLSRGVLNLVSPSFMKEAGRGLLLVGGPSAAHGWNSLAIVEQITTIVTDQPKFTWKLTTSRRTPPDFLGLLRTHQLANLTIVPHEETDPDWVPSELSRSSQVWVSEDSVSMVYEALTSGASVGLLEVPQKQVGRVARGVQELRAQGWVTRFSDWDRSRSLPAPAHPLHEANRCAALICERFQLADAA
ncbi:mitochondrial fission ELM1 family protein [Bythopirellula polymerisocia]|uniref:Nucleoside-diphosphate sugar epimerase n=1 Tax=Bythopirellula polymerisocia TaxID=2528003 RepID=A0A5C6CTA6_9BACT|nr:mitochondrial fission ELM1 family protein [Bythopirellula polymerisocia]TWU28173.1 hypothetical protein Pla144_14600 [Bythopirellula polymerisocia]